MNVLSANLIAWFAVQSSSCAPHAQSDMPEEIRESIVESDKFISALRNCRFRIDKKMQGVPDEEYTCSRNDSFYKYEFSRIGTGVATVSTGGREYFFRLARRKEGDKYSVESAERLSLKDKEYAEHALSHFNPFQIVAAHYMIGGLRGFSLKDLFERGSARVVRKSASGQGNDRLVSFSIECLPMDKFWVVSLDVTIAPGMNYAMTGYTGKYDNSRHSNPRIASKQAHTSSRTTVKLVRVNKLVVPEVVETKFRIGWSESELAATPSVYEAITDFQLVDVPRAEFLPSYYGFDDKLIQNINDRSLRPWFYGLFGIAMIVAGGIGWRRRATNKG